MCTTFEGIDGASRLEHDPPAAANSAVGFGRPMSEGAQRRKAFFCARVMAGCAWEGFGPAGFLRSRSTNPRTVPPPLMVAMRRTPTAKEFHHASTPSHTVQF